MTHLRGGTRTFAADSDIPGYRLAESPTSGLWRAGRGRHGVLRWRLCRRASSGHDGSMTEQAGGDDIGVVIARGPEGRRSSTALGRTVVAAALRAADPVGAAAAERETNWRSGYLGHFRRLVEAGLPSRAAALGIAAEGLHAVHDQLRFRGPDGAEMPLGAAIAEDGPAGEPVTV